MLTIKDMAVDKELTAKEMASVVGGSNFTFGNGAVSFNTSGGSIASLGDGNTNTVNNNNRPPYYYPGYPVAPVPPHPYC